MNALEMARSVQAAIAADADVIAYAIQKYGVKPTVYVGMDAADPPAESDYPVIALHEFFISGGGTGSRTNVFEISLAAGVINATIDYDALARTRFYMGLIEADQLRALAFSAIVKNHFGKVFIKDGDIGSAMAHPMYVSGMTVVIEQIASRARTD
jgi:hypothetical protein